MTFAAPTTIFVPTHTNPAPRNKAQMPQPFGVVINSLKSAFVRPISTFLIVVSFHFYQFSFSFESACA